MSAEEEHVALPHLYGAPAYARPPSIVTPTVVLDPDDLPLAVEQTPEEREVAERLLASPYVVAEQTAAAKPEPRPQQQPMLLNFLADRILRRAS
jgi:hypothetical protein